MSEPNDIARDILRDKLSEIRSEAHYAYALMAGLPKENFYLHRYYDCANNVDGEDPHFMWVFQGSTNFFMLVVPTAGRAVRKRAVPRKGFCRTVQSKERGSNG